MSAPCLLIDNDILILLSCSGLLDDAINALGFNRPSAFHLGTLPHIMKTDEPLQQLPDVQKNLIRVACEDLPVIVERPSIATQKSLDRIYQINYGEAVLYGLAVDHSAYLVTSGDKGAMRALASNPKLQHIRQTLSGRIICLEVLCVELIKIHGVFGVAEAFAPLIPRHNSIKTYFGAVHVSGEAGCHNAIQHYLELLEAQLGDTLLWRRQ